MLMYVEGDIFKTPAKVLVNAVNTVGIMGKGIAREFKRLYPDMFKKYQHFCESGQLDIGKLWLYRNGGKNILNFPTKKHWRQPSKAEYIQRGLDKFVETYSSHGITSVAFPHIGCGNGELDWDKVVHPLMQKYLSPLPIDIFVYSFAKKSASPEHHDVDAMRAWLRSDPVSLGFVEVWDDICKAISANSIQINGSTDIMLVRDPFEGIVIKEYARRGFENVKEKLRSIIPFWPQVLGPHDIFISREHFLTLWQSVRERGYCVAEIMPPGLDEIPDFVIGLLSQLNFMEPIVFQLENKKSVKGLQFFRPRHNEDLESYETISFAQAV